MNQALKNCSSKSFKALMTTQFLGALNDNIFKLVLVLIVVGEATTTTWLVLISVCFNLPYILFSPFAGSLADRFSKTHIVRATKVMEVGVMSLALYFFAIENKPGLYAVLFLMGTQSALFSPSKYGILPEILEEEDLSRGNGYLEFWTFIAIILGTALGGVIKHLSGGDYLLPGIVVVSVATLGLFSSFWVGKTPVANPKAKFKLNPLGISTELREMFYNRGLWLALLGLTFFWSIGALYQLSIPLSASRLGGFDDLETALLLAGLGLGIGVGSIFAGVVSAGRVELGLVPIGAVGISIFSLVLSMCFGSYGAVMLLLVLLGLSSGFFVVPLNAYLQHQSPLEKRGRYLAASNFAAFLGMIYFSFLLILLVDVMGLSTTSVFVMIGLITAGVAVYVCRLLPEMLVRCLNWILFHTVYRLKVVGEKNVPKSGGALLVCNHVSYVDAALLLASGKRAIRFLMYRPVYDMPLIKRLADVVRAIPIPQQEKPKEALRALKEAKRSIEAGELVCIFAEGSLTRSGNMLGFQRGLERIMKGVDAPIIPVHLDQTWGSIFSYREGKVFWKLPKQIPYPVTISYGKALAGGARAFEVRQAVQELGAQAVSYRKEAFQLLHSGFIRTAKRFLFRPCIADSQGKELSYAKALSAAMAFSFVLKKRLREEEMVGVLLPPSSGAALVNIALQMAGVVPVNLNYTASKEAVESSLSQCGVSKVISSPVFVEKIGLELSCDTLWLEELVKEITLLKKCFWGVLGVALPSCVLDRLLPCEKKPRQSLATVIFSSGSTGEPKGVMLSHDNIASNIESIYELFQLSSNDCVFGVLPFFHSFGFTATLWLPLLSGIKAAYHVNPLDAATVGQMVKEHQASIMFATPTFLLSYLRRCDAEQFASLRYMIVGAERLKDRVADAFYEKFGVMPWEGYGCTELSPVVSINVRDYSLGESTQVGHKKGTVGHPLPSVAVRVVDADSFSVLGPGEPGLLLVRGPNVMLGYLGSPEKTAGVMRDGWYVTGDIAVVDSDGFVSITDRLSRFSKIGGEMVPHVKVEEEIHQVLGETETVCVVTAVPDEKKGERLVVLCVVDMDGKEICRKLAERGLPNLWIPKKEAFLRVESLPMLGSGKLDLQAIKKIALDKAG